MIGQIDIFYLDDHLRFSTIKSFWKKIKFSNLCFEDDFLQIITMTQFLRIVQVFSLFCFL